MLTDDETLITCVDAMNILQRLREQALADDQPMTSPDSSHLREEVNE